jgi:hypothetical protein
MHFSINSDILTSYFSIQLKLDLSSSIAVCVIITTGTCLLSHCIKTNPLTANIGEIHIQTHRESRLTGGELLEAEFSLRSNPKLYKEDNPTVGRRR